ncbi:putative DNA 3'-phosphatase Tpp1 [Tothia fuscella]|uniref:DNA 3'-phosphatase Tpp1 n=1 Tax=Tothia fuscella TaxID=1048955 RepID=A0A9P4TT73_9PEZI|nr:putative DNA 3'-phosphatase Tpp1 [Tothia fuscella]
MKREATEDGSVSPPPVKRRQQSSTTNKAVSNFFKPASQKEPEKVTWRIVDGSLLVGRYHVEGQSSENKVKVGKRRIAAFDFDSTLISTKSKLRFARDANDWQWWNPVVPSTLRNLYDQGYTLAILSNQAAISLKNTKGDMKSLSNFKNKATIVFSRLDLPISIYAATEKDRFRKPRLGMWQVLLGDLGLGIEDVDLEGSIFVGDAAGRGESVRNGVKFGKDHSCCDRSATTSHVSTRVNADAVRDFAANAGIGFKTPEEFFLNEEPMPFTRAFDPVTFLSTPTPLDTTPLVFSKTNEVELVLSCGSPGSGKSSFYWKHLQPLGYERVNQDILKTRDRCLKVAEDFLREGKSVAVDNTNANIEARAYWVNLAKKYNVPVRCVYFTASHLVCEHNDKVRALNEGVLNPEKRTMLPMVAFTSYAQRRQEPRLDEGFQDITKVDFVFEGTDNGKAIWTKYWI